MVGRVCLKCLKSDHVRDYELPELQCDWCGELLRVSQEIGRHRDYWYFCPQCNRKWKLALLLPFWSELFPYCGLAADQDYER